jgi:hypothetical protein
MHKSSSIVKRNFIVNTIVAIIFNFLSPLYAMEITQEQSFTSSFKGHENLNILFLQGNKNDKHLVITDSMPTKFKIAASISKGIIGIGVGVGSFAGMLVMLLASTQILAGVGAFFTVAGFISAIDEFSTATKYIKTYKAYKKAC